MLALREAEAGDTALILGFIRELAAYEKLAHECVANEESLRQWLFCPQPKAYCVIAEWEGKPAAFALYFYNFSTFLGCPGIYLEDLFVRPEYRRKGIARRLFHYLAQKAVREGCGRLEWWVLDWNVDALAFYKGLGAQSMDEWTVQRISGESLRALAGGAE
ncbi:MAG: GNAT family N-acetyltransferase [Alphaproteobacteria bacterium]|nr:GNAT family N-acetyltransferase [Alphaproteobacteria bacterium]